MNIYRISQTQNGGYDTYDSAVVCAPSEDVARNMNPSNGAVMTAKEWDNPFGTWCSRPDQVTVQLIGTANDSQHQGIVCSSFNAG